MSTVLYHSTWNNTYLFSQWHPVQIHEILVANSFLISLTDSISTHALHLTLNLVLTLKYITTLHSKANETLFFFNLGLNLKLHDHCFTIFVIMHIFQFRTCLFFNFKILNPFLLLNFPMITDSIIYCYADQVYFAFCIFRPGLMTARSTK